MAWPQSGVTAWWFKRIGFRQHYQGGGHFPARTPAMSPDGAVTVFLSPSTGNGDIYQIDRDGSQRIRLTDNPAFETDPVFSLDGSIIAFAREADGRRHIWLMGRDGSRQRQLTSGRVLDDPWRFSPDGAALIFQRSPLSITVFSLFGLLYVSIPVAILVVTAKCLATSSCRMLWLVVSGGIAGIAALFGGVVFAENRDPEIDEQIPLLANLAVCFAAAIGVLGFRMAHALVRRNAPLDSRAE